MKQSISTPVAIGIVAIAVVLIAVIGWRYLSAGSRDKDGHDLNAPAVQPSNLGEIMQSRINAAHGTGRASGTTPAAPGGTAK